MQHCVFFVWAHVFGHGNSLVLDNENISVLGDRPHSWKLTEK